MHHSKLLFWRSTIWLIICTTATAVAQAQDAQTAPKQLVFSAGPGTKGTLYKIDDARVTDPLRGLGKAIEKYGDELPVVCLIDSRLPIRMVGESVATAGKAGFRNVRSFAVDHTTGHVAEIKLGPWMSLPN